MGDVMNIMMVAFTAQDISLYPIRLGGPGSTSRF